MFKYNRREKTIEKDSFANYSCELLYHRFNGDLQQIFESGKLKTLYDMFEYHVRNIYEMIGSDIPLFAYYELRSYTMDNPL